MHYRSEQTVYTPESRKTVKLHRISEQCIFTPKAQIPR